MLILVVISRLISRFRMKSAARTDKRVQIMNEIVSGMRVIKMYTWENSYADILAKARE